MTLKEMTNKQLKHEYEITYDLITNQCCYGTSDLRWMMAIENELNQRKIKFKRVWKIEWGGEE